MGDKVLTFDYTALQPYLYDCRADIASGSDSGFTYKADYLNTSLNTSADWNTSITTTTGEFCPNYTFQNYYTYSNSFDVEKEIAEEINRLVLNEIEQKYLIKSISKDLLKIKKVKINKCYLIKI